MGERLAADVNGEGEVGLNTELLLFVGAGRVVLDAASEEDGPLSMSMGCETCVAGAAPARASAAVRKEVGAAFVAVAAPPSSLFSVSRAPCQPFLPPWPQQTFFMEP